MYMVVWYGGFSQRKHSVATASSHTVFVLYSVIQKAVRGVKIHVYTEDGFELDPEKGLALKGRKEGE